MVREAKKVKIGHKCKTHTWENVIPESLVSYSSKKRKSKVETVKKILAEHSKTNAAEFAYVFSDKKFDEIKHMSVRARLQWLEEANAFINKTIGFKKRAEFDERFKGMGKR